MSLYVHIKELLQQNENFSKAGEIFKNKIVEAALKLDPLLISILVKDEKSKSIFFVEVEGILVFDKIKFQKFVSNKDFLPDSFTAFKNKIGLTANGEYLTEAKEVVLDYPYKDCVLEGGQTKEDQKRQEIFWNETLAPDEIDRLFEPKALTNWKKYDKDGEHEVSNITLDDNLIIKGNNLIALHSLKRIYKGKIKLIYIDPPYNTGKDGFKYNDSFNHSSWLTFMKNRLEVARELLTPDGSIWISLDDNEVHYCKVLMDEIFGRENFISTIIWNSKYTVSNDAKYVSYQHENILFYAKDKSKFKIGLFDRTAEQNASYRNPDNDPKGPWKATPIYAKSGKDEQNYTVTFENGYSWTPPKGCYPRYSKKTLIEKYEKGELYFNKNGGVDRKTYLSEVKQGVTVGSVWGYNVVGHTHSNNEELAALVGKGAFDNPKGTKLIKKILKVGNVSDNDLVLDYHLGSGTTAHAVLDYNLEENTSVRIIGIEQMSYIETVTKNRLLSVLNNNRQEQSFVFTEMMELNGKYLNEIKNINNIEKSKNFLFKILNGNCGNLNYKIDCDTINIDDFTALNLEDQKQFLKLFFDNNMIYLPYSDINDKDYNVNLKDIKINNQFYTL